MSTTLMFLAPGGFVAALICFRSFRFLVFWALIAWMVAYAILHSTAQAQEPIVVCTMNSGGQTEEASAGWCDLYQILKDNAMEDLARGEQPFRRCMETINGMSPPLRPVLDGQIVIARNRLCLKVNTNATTDWMLRRRT